MQTLDRSGILRRSKVRCPEGASIASVADPANQNLLSRPRVEVGRLFTSSVENWGGGMTVTVSLLVASSPVPYFSICARPPRQHSNRPPYTPPGFHIPSHVNAPNFLTMTTTAEPDLIQNEDILIHFDDSKAITHETRLRLVVGSPFPHH